MTQRDVESFADFLQYYQHSYVRSRSDPRVLYFVHGNADPMKTRAYVSVYKEGKQPGVPQYMTERQIDEDFVWGIPLIGMTVLDERELVYMYYRTARNGTRGYNASRVVQYSFNGHVLRQNGLKARVDRLDSSSVAYAVVSQKHATLEYAYEDLTSKRPTQLAHALTYKFGVHLTEEEHPLLCYKTLEIGEVIAPKKVRLLSQFKEIGDLMKRAVDPKIDVEVV